MYTSVLLLSSLLAVARGQLAGTQKTETHPSMTWKQCTSASSCTTKQGKIVIDSNWRWLHAKGTYTNCYTGNKWNATACPDNKACAANCELDGADYQATYGATASGDALTLKFVTKGADATNIGSRFYMMETDTKYQMYTLTNQEFAFDVDLSKLPCGLNGALYFVSMDADGGMSKYSTNKAGAKYGTGYCDAQCPRDLKFINGEGNVEGWTTSSNDNNAGVGGHGSCCAEMDVWEANSIATAYTPHSCATTGQTRCDGDACGGTYSATRYAGPCDPDGCDFNSYRMGDTSFYGKGKTVDTSKKFTVVTAFKGSGDSLDIQRYYIQDGKTIPNSQSLIDGVTGNSVNTAFCDAQKAAFGDRYTFKEKGGMANMSSALSKGMVLVMSLWDDHYANMLWLDSTYPTTGSGPGYERGDCPTSSGVPADVESQNADSTVVYSNIRTGPLGAFSGST